MVSNVVRQKILDKIVTVIFILFIGFSLGYGMRMHHEQTFVKSKNNAQINAVYKDTVTDHKYKIVF